MLTELLLIVLILDPRLGLGLQFQRGGPFVTLGIHGARRCEPTTALGSSPIDYENQDGVVFDIISPEDGADLTLEFPPERNSDDGTMMANAAPLQPLNVSAISSDVSYFYLRDELGLSDEAMYKFAFEAGSVLGTSAKILRQKVDLLRGFMDLTDDDLRTMLARHPAVMQLSANKNMAPTLLFLQRSLDLSKEDLRTIIVPYPSLIGNSIANLNYKITFFTEMMGYTTEECRNLVLSEPRLMTSGVNTGLIPRMKFFLSELGMSMDDLRVVIVKNPLVPLMSVDANLRPKIAVLFMEKLQMHPRRVIKMLLKYPKILNYNLERHMLPISKVFVSELGFSPSEFGVVLFKFPRLMSHSVFKIHHVVGYLNFQVGMDCSQVKRILYQAPQVVGLSREGNLNEKMEYLRSALNLTDAELRKVIAGTPTLLLCSIESNLRPKLEFLRSSLRNERQLHDVVVVQPTLLAYSLERRIRPRMAALLEAGGDPSDIRICIPMKEEGFRSWLDRRKERSEKRASSEKSIFPSIDVSGKGDLSGRVVHWNRERTRPPKKQ